MSFARSLLSRSLLVIALLAPALHAMGAPALAADCAGIQILSDELTTREAQAYCVYAVAERRKVEEFWGATWRNNDGALLHEIVHVYAPNDNRFLAEGLAVYLHQKLAGNPAFPNYGRALDAEARGRLAHIESLEKLNGVRTPRPLGTGLGEESAYILAGSFVGFLVENHGLAEFRTLYEAGTYEAAYGKSLRMLESEWRSALLRSN
jgi:hypothetical protein